MAEHRRDSLPPWISKQLPFLFLYFVSLSSITNQLLLPISITIHVHHPNSFSAWFPISNQGTSEIENISINGESIGAQMPRGSDWEPRRRGEVAEAAADSWAHAVSSRRDSPSLPPPSPPAFSFSARVCILLIDRWILFFFHFFYCIHLLSFGCDFVLILWVSATSTMKDPCLVK